MECRRRTWMRARSGRVLSRYRSRQFWVYCPARWRYLPFWDPDVWSFYVTHWLLLMDLPQPQTDLRKHAQQQLLREGSGLFANQSLQIALWCVLHDDAKLVGCRVIDLFEGDYIRVHQHAVQLCLSFRAFLLGLWQMPNVNSLHYVE